MAIARGNISHVNSNSDPSTPLAHTIAAGNDRILWVMASAGDSTITNRNVIGITYGGVALTKGWEKDDANFLNTEGWYLVAPAVGTADIVVDWGAAPGLAEIIGVNYTGVGTLSAPVTNSGSSATASKAITSAVGEVIIASISSDSEGGITETGTVLWEEENVGSDCSFGAQEYAGAASVTIQWAQSITGWAVGGMAMQPAGAAAAAPFVTQLGAMVAGYGKPYPSGLCSIALGASLSLLAAAGQAPFTQSHWPTPPTKPTVISQRTHLQSRPTFYTEPTGAAPFTQHRWPIPSTGRSVLLVTTQTVPLDTASVSVILPLRLTEFPVPQAKPYPSVLRTWTQARPSYYPEVIPLRQADWPLPVAPVVSGALRGWTLRANMPTSLPLPGPPIPQLDWPLPVRAVPTAMARLGFIGFYALDDAAPLRAAGSFDRPIAPRVVSFSLQIAQSRSIALSDQVPVHQIDWPLPARAMDRLRTLSTITQGRWINLTDLTPNHLTDWPLMRGRTAPVTQLTWTQSVLGSPLSIPQAGWGPLLGSRRNRLIQGVA